MDQATAAKRFYPVTLSGSLGDIERLAGIEDRVAFWRAFDHRAYPTTQAYIDAGMTEARKLIAKRVVRGEVSLLVTDERVDRFVSRMRRQAERSAT